MGSRPLQKIRSISKLVVGSKLVHMNSENYEYCFYDDDGDAWMDGCTKINQSINVMSYFKIIEYKAYIESH